ncbi:hypothetical protein EQG49_04415 [Periweissella cryptocerci]|uniref:PH domain-containing protein n=1 Tax=Periweissella cryptocerci TaxID=2506420 RepID=A0A4P6YSQ5_9LACO|nr:hypothetical protein [Periweissella cryptocerci]QBO35759.1 hypothetical protein EQG49_04415 [Periweissella cryptocerci]
MSKYQLNTNEIMVKEYTSGSHIVGNKHLSGELVLTNRNLVWVNVGMFGSVKGIDTFNLRDIKVFDDKVQIKLSGIDDSHLDIYFKNHVETFSFIDRKEATNWANEINHVITDSDEDIIAPETHVIPGEHFLREP